MNGNLIEICIISLTSKYLSLLCRTQHQFQCFSRHPRHHFTNLLAACCIVVHVRLCLVCSWAPQFILSSLPNNLNANKRIIGSIGTSFWSRGGVASLFLAINIQFEQTPIHSAKITSTIA